jgi:hypothetical protein
VQYNPSNDQWRLFTRHNVSSTFDPTTLGPADGKGGQIDNTYTSLYLSYMGLYASLEDRNTATESVRLKSLKIRKNVSLIESPTTGLCGAITALPVEFDGMSMSCVEAGVNLNWITFSELNNDHFSIERSSDGVDFEKIANISGQGTSSQLSTYSWIDERPIMGTSYYRLSQTDYNGEKTALGTLSSVWPCTDLSAELTVYPNPTTGDVQLIFRQEGRHEYTVEVINSFGQIVLDHMTGLASGEGVTTIELNSQSLPRGVYSVHLKVGENIYTEKLVRQ